MNEGMKKKKYISFFIFLFTCFVSCNNDETCRKDRFVTMNVKFYQDTISVNTGDTVTQSLSVDSLTIYGLGVDSILYKNKKKVSSVQLPLNLFAGESSFVLICNDTYDTLTVRHTNKNKFLSLECGNIRVHHIDSAIATGHFFPRATIINPDVNTDDETNIQLHNIK